MHPRLKNILFIDIETAAQHAVYDDLEPRLQELWAKKARTLKATETEPHDLYHEKAAIYAEFGKVICIGLGGFFEENKITKFKSKVLGNLTEKETLEAFQKVLEEHSAKEELILCAHNGKEFDFPYLSRRFLVNGLKLPYVLDNSAKKPWEVQHLDTLEFWKFGDYKHFTSLDLLSAIFNIPSSKTELDGSQVNRTYHTDKDLEKIKRYCQNDVVVLAQLYLKLNALELLSEENIIRL